MALVVLGPKKLLEAGRSIGNGLREFKDWISGDSPVTRREARTQGRIGPALSSGA